MKKLLILALATLLITGLIACGDSTGENSSSADIISTESQSIVSSSTANSDVSLDENSEESINDSSDEISNESLDESSDENSTPTAETSVNINYASEQILNQYNSYDEFTDNCGSESIIFYTGATVKDFCFIAVTWDENDENPFECSNPTPQDVLYSTEQLTPEKPLVINNTYIRETAVSYRGIKFTDENNTVRYFYVIDSGKDGLTLVEFTNEIN